MKGLMFMEKAVKLPSGSWRIRVYYTDEKGVRKRKSITADTKKEAERLAVQFSSNRNKKTCDLSLGDVVDRYIASKDSVLSPTTISSYKRIRKNYFGELYDVPISRLTIDMCQSAVNQLASVKSAKTTANAWGLISAALAIYDPGTVYRITLPQRVKKFKDLPSAEDVLKVIVNTEIELPCLLALWLSLRMSEVRGLRKSDVKNGKLYIQNSIVTVDGKHIEKSSTKTYESARIHEIPPYIQTLIDRVEGEYLTELSGQAIYKRFSRLLEKNGLPHITFHDLRHMNASIMHALGVPDKYAMERGGWSTTNVLKSVYQHTLSSEREKQDEKINEYFDSLIENNK